MKPAGEWNTFEITCKGKDMALWVNGAVTCEWHDCEAYPKGYVGLEAEGFRIEFRNGEKGQAAHPLIFPNETPRAAIMHLQYGTKGMDCSTYSAGRGVDALDQASIPPVEVVHAWTRPGGASQLATVIERTP